MQWPPISLARPVAVIGVALVGVLVPPPVVGQTPGGEGIAAISPPDGATLTWTGRRPVFAWSQGDGVSDEVDLFSLDLGPTPELIATYPILLPDDYPESIPVERGVDKAIGSEPLLVGNWAWRVRGEGEAGPFESRLFTFSVVPPALDHLRVRLSNHFGFSRARPGISLITIDTTPYADLEVTLRRRGRVLDRASYGWEGRYSYEFRWNCTRPGRTTVEVAATDAYGARRRWRGRIDVPTCREVEARERRAIARAEREARSFRRRCRRSGGRVANRRGERVCIRDGVVIIIVLIP